MARETPIDCILDVLELIERIERQTANLTRETFIADADVQDATAYRIWLLASIEARYQCPQNAFRYFQSHYIRFITTNRGGGNRVVVIASAFAGNLYVSHELRYRFFHIAPGTLNSPYVR